jgi:TonB family protein
MASFFLLFITAALKGTIVLSAAGLITLAMRRQSAAARHLVWTAALAGILALPFLSITLPTLRIPVPAASDFIFQTTASALAEQPHPAIHSTPQLPPTQPAVTLDWPTALLALWALGAAIALIRLLAASHRMAKLRHTAPAFSDDSGSVELRQLEPGQMPMTFGILRPVIFMPADAAQWPADRRHAVLLHELAHVTRHDVATHLLARLAVALYWWNPAVWMAWKQFLKEQERAADDLVLASGARATEYATHLLDVARTLIANPAPVAVAMARPSQLEGRIAAILDSTANRANPGRAFAIFTTLAAAAIILPFAAAQNYETSRKLLDDSATRTAQVSGPSSSNYGIELIKLGDLESSNHHDAAARDFYARAVQILGKRPEAAPALIYLGAAAILDENFAQATDYFDQAQAADPTLVGATSMWKGVVLARKKNWDDARPLFEQALAIEGQSADAVLTMRVFARSLRESGKAAEADEMRSRANAMQSSNTIPPPFTGQAFRVGHGVSAPTLDEKNEAVYSLEARAASLAGTISVSAIVGTDGQAHNLTVVKGLGLGLDEEAVEAIQQWRFKPGRKDREPVNVRAIIEVNFHLL